MSARPEGKSSGRAFQLARDRCLRVVPGAADPAGNHCPVRGRQRLAALGPCLFGRLPYRPDHPQAHPSLPRDGHSQYPGDPHRGSGALHRPHRLAWRHAGVILHPEVCLLLSWNVRLPACSGIKVALGTASGLTAPSVGGCGKTFNALTGTSRVRWRHRDCWVGSDEAPGPRGRRHPGDHTQVGVQHEPIGAASPFRVSANGVRSQLGLA